jgi:hypothetical protein
MPTVRKETKLIPVDGGVDEYHDIFNMADNRKRSCVDYHISGGVLSYRPGRRKWGPDFTERIDGVCETIDPDNVVRLLVKSGNDVWQVESGSKTSLDSGLTQEVTNFVTHRGRCWYNGPSTQRKITRDVAAPVGLAAPTQAPTISHSSTGLTGAYAWKYTFVIEEAGIKVWESNPSLALIHSLSNENAVLLADASADARVNARYFYRTTASGNVYQYTGKVSDNIAASSYTDTVADALLGSVIEDNHGVPVQGTIACGCNERMFWIDKDKLRYSEQAHTEAYQEYQGTALNTNFILLPNGGYGTSLKKIYNATTAREDLYIFQAGALHALPGGDPNQTIVTVSETIGCASHQSVVEYDGGLVFRMSSGAVGYYKGGHVVDLTSRSIPVSIAGLLDRETSTGSVIFGSFYALCDRNRADVIYSNVVWICDLRTIKEVQNGFADAVWFRWDINAAYLLSRKDGTLLYFDSHESHVFTLSLEYRDDEILAGGAYTGFRPLMETKAFNFGAFSRWHPHYLKIVGQQGNDMAVTVNYGSEFRKGSAQLVTTAPVTASFIVGRSKMGQGRMSSVANMISGGVPLKVAGIFISFKFEKSGPDNFFYISGFQFTYTVFPKV